LINSNLGFPAEKSEIMAAENVDVTGNTTISSVLWALTCTHMVDVRIQEKVLRSGVKLPLLDQG